MIQRDFDKVTELYDQGFRCIKYQTDENGKFEVFLKNFEDENIDSLVCGDVAEIARIKDYIDNY